MRLSNPSRQQGSIFQILLCVIAIVILGIAAAMYLTHGLADTAREQLDALKAGNITGAYEMTTAAFQSETSLEQFTYIVEKNPILTNYAELNVIDRKIENGIGYLSGTLTSTDGEQKNFEYQFVKENNRWKIQSFQLTDIEVKTETPPVPPQLNNTEEKTLSN